MLNLVLNGINQYLIAEVCPGERSLMFLFLKMMKF